MRPLTILLLLMAMFHSVSARALDENLQCVPYARAITGVEIYGDAHTWWGQAQGRYERGGRPKVGAVMSFKPHGGMRLGHVAAVRKIVDSRTVIVSQSNWATINGKRGHIGENIPVIDVSENNDWSQVQVWYSPNQAMGGTKWPLNGFIYPKQKRSEDEMRVALAKLIGPGARVAPVQMRGISDVRVAAYTPPKPRAAVPTFQLSGKTLVDVNAKSTGERKTAWQKPAPAAVAPQKDAIGDLLGSLGS